MIKTEYIDNHIFLPVKGAEGGNYCEQFDAFGPVSAMVYGKEI